MAQIAQGDQDLIPLIPLIPNTEGPGLAPRQGLNPPVVT
jgi:hypothetical protein